MQIKFYKLFPKINANEILCVYFYNAQNYLNLSRTYNNTNAYSKFPFDLSNFLLGMCPKINE